MRFIVLATISMALAIGCTDKQPHPMQTASQPSDSAKAGDVGTIYPFQLDTIDGRPQSLDIYRGKTLLLVNVASRCGYTRQYGGLEQLYQKYKDRGFLVLGFPANNFGGQEPGTNEEIKQFCSTNFGVTFPMFAKISVKGADKHPLYTFLTEQQSDPELNGEVTWNFNKFLVGPDGRVVARYASSVEPDNAGLTMAIEKTMEL